MTTLKKLEAGFYETADGKFIKKESSGWYVLNSNMNVEFGPLSTLNSAKEYIQTDNVSIGSHNLGTKHGRRQGKKDFYAHLASESKNGNLGPAILYFLVMLAIAIFFTVMKYKK